MSEEMSELLRGETGVVQNALDRTWFDDLPCMNGDRGAFAIVRVDKNDVAAVLAVEDESRLLRRPHDFAARDPRKLYGAVASTC